jgi:hypothetical protein
MARFKPGQSGNPAGKPRGTRHATTRLREAIAADLHAIVAALVEKARDGDTGAAALLFSRTLPPLRPQSDPLDTELNGNTPDERAESVIHAAMAGKISPTAANELVGLLAQQCRIKEVGELTERIARIEAALQLSEKSK